MKILLAGPGTGKTTKIRSLLADAVDPSRALVISFTNATVNDLLVALSDAGLGPNNCMTLHKFAVKYNHDTSRHVLHPFEETRLQRIGSATELGFDQLCDFLECTTFDQMVLRFVAFAQSNDTYLAEKLSDIDALIVDEYQDFNPAEQELIDLLVKHIPDAYILGDDDQCIYDFKDASTDKIIELHKQHESLEHEHICYRCPDKIVDCASNLIANNTQRVPKAWEKSGKDGHVEFGQYLSQEEVAGYVVQEIQRIQAGTPESTILVLSPVGFAADLPLNFHPA